MIEIPTIEEITKILEPIKKELQSIRSGAMLQTYLTTAELAEYLKTSAQQVRVMIHRGIIPGGTKKTGKWLFKKNIIDEWLSK